MMLRFLWTSFDYLTPEKIQDFIVVGGIVDFQMFALGELSKPMQKWMSRRVFSVEERLKKINFPDQSHSDTQPVEITFTVPKYVYMSPDASSVDIKIWDKAK